MDLAFGADGETIGLREEGDLVGMRGARNRARAAGHSGEHNGMGLLAGMIVDDGKGFEFGRAVWRFIDWPDVSKLWVGKLLDARVHRDVVCVIGDDGVAGEGEAVVLGDEFSWP